jgi:hypothetical protein
MWKVSSSRTSSETYGKGNEWKEVRPGAWDEVGDYSESTTVRSPFMIAAWNSRQSEARKISSKTTYSAAAVWVCPALVALAPLIGSTLVAARRDDAISDEGDVVAESLFLAELVLLQAGKALVHDVVVERGSEDCGGPVALALHLFAPSTGILLCNSRFVDVVLSRSRQAVPEEVLLLVRVGQPASLTRTDSDGEGHGLGAWPG